VLTSRLHERRWTGTIRVRYRTSGAEQRYFHGLDRR
jgi:hypothetical protein